MVAAAMKHMASGFAKLEKIERVDFKRWKKKMHFMISSMSVVYVLTTPMPEDRGENPTVEQVRKRTEWNNDEYVYIDLILNRMSNSLFDIYQNEELTLVELGSHLGIEESLRAQDTDKPKDNNVAGPSVVNMVEHNNSSMYNDHKGKRKHHDTRANPSKKRKDDDVAWWVDSGATIHMCKDRCWFKTYELLNDGCIIHMGNESTALVHGSSCVDLGFSYGKVVAFLNVLHVANIRKNLVSSSVLNNCGYKQVIESKKFVLSKHAFMSTSKLNDLILWHARLGHVHFKRMQDMSKDGLILVIDMDPASDLCDLHATPSLGNKKYFLTFIDDASRFSVIEPNDSIAINSIIESRDAIFDEHMFSSVPRPSQRTLMKVNGTVEKFKARLVIQGFNQNSRIDYFDTYVPVTAFLNRDLEEEVYMNQPIGFIMPGNENKQIDASGKGVIICLYVNDTLVFGTNQVHVDLTKKFLSSRPDFVFAVGKLSRLVYSSYPLVLEGYTNASWISNTKDNSSTSGWVFLLGGGAISWASKKQTCITSSIMESKFMALAAACKEAEWLKNLLFEIPFWVKPMARISISCDSAATLVKAYSQMYNGNSRYLCVRHSMIHKLSMNGVVSIEFMMS
nr:zinc finger, CCHC-type [Tanacetum cinerariifolium]